MADFGQELAALNFGAMIGGPLIAVINAQARAAMSTVDFVKTIGFQRDRSVNVVFNYTKTVEDPAGRPRELDCSLSVPILTMMPIPFLRVEETSVEFNAKLVGTETSSRESMTGANAELGAKWGGGALSALGGPSVEFKTTFAYQSKNSQGAKLERTYSLNVKVRAVQDQMPGGMERLLSILENSIREDVKPLPETATQQETPSTSAPTAATPTK